MWDKTCIPTLKPFIKKCLLTCWMMIVQNPPMCIQTDTPGAKVKMELFKFYTTSGPYVDYIVWPALLLYEGGPVVCKGVVQGIATQ